MRRLGADAVIDYRTQDFPQLGPRFDVVFDIGDHAASGALTPVLGGRFPLDRIAGARGAAETSSDGTVIVNPTTSGTPVAARSLVG